MPVKKVIKRCKTVQIGLDMRRRFAMAERIDGIEMSTIVIANQCKQFVQNNFRQRRQFASVQRNIERQNTGLAELVERKPQGRNGPFRIDFQCRLRGLFAEIAIGTVEVAAQRRHIEQMDGAPKHARHGKIRHQPTPVGHDEPDQ